MSSSIVNTLDRQIQCVEETLHISKSLREKILSLENEKNEALNKCKSLEAKINRMKEEQCSNCTTLLNKLTQERKERERLKKEEKAKLLKTIAKTLEIDDGLTNQMSNAQQMLTQLVSGSTKKNRLIEDECSSDDESVKVFVDETVIAVDSEDSSNECRNVAPIVVPETELQGLYKKTSVNKRQPRVRHLQENRISSDDEPEPHQINKKPKCEQVQPVNNEKSFVMPAKKSALNSSSLCPDKSLLKNQNEKSPSVLITEATDEIRIEGAEEQNTKWRMKPSFIVDSNVNAANGKKLKQMTLSLTRPEKKHDISLSGGFKGGLTTDHNEEKDIVLPSPDRELKKYFSRKHEVCETMEDPDVTVFQPNAASTCYAMETSFDKLPERAESPPYKYRRDTVRKKEKRMKLPGQDCDECAQYYKAAGLDKTQDIKLRMNECSRHRDKYQLRALTPPGFWDPVFPTTPEDDQGKS